MKTRKVAWIGAGLLAAALLLGSLSTTLAQTIPQGPWGPGGMMGGPGHGGMMQGYGPGAGHGPGGMMGGAGGADGPMGPGMMGMGPGAGQATPITSLDEARTAFQGYLDRLGNTDLKLDEVMQFQWNYYAIVKEQSTGSGAFELLADPQSGWVYPEHGPNMMWNTRYGHMAWVQGGAQPTVQPGVSKDQARQIAQQWLDANQPGSGAEEPDAFYGYYTVHTVKDGAVGGMLSVNAYTGQAWYHTWHGSFVASTEVSG